MPKGIPKNGKQTSNKLHTLPGKIRIYVKFQVIIPKIETIKKVNKAIYSRVLPTLFSLHY